MLWGSVTNLRRPAVSHTNTHHVLMIWFMLESVWRIIQTLWGNDKDLFVCICKRVFLAGLLAAARIAKWHGSLLACLLIYLCVLEWAEPTEVWRNDYRALRHPRIDGCQPEAPGRLLRPPPSRKSLPAVQHRPSIRAVTTTVRWCSVWSQPVEGAHLVT